MAQEPETQRPRRRPVRKTATAADHRAFSTLDERDYWIHRLLNLSVRQGKPWGIKGELTAALNGHPVFAPLLARLDKLTPPPESTPDTEVDGTVPARLLQFRSDAYELIHQALKIIEAQPLLVLGDSLRAEVDAAVQNRLWAVFKYVAPTILVLIFGGSIYGYVHFQ